MDALGSLAAALERLVLVRDDGGFVLGGVPPAWFHRLAGGAPEPGEGVDIERLLPFLEAFLPEAEQAWAHEGALPLRSCIFTETTAVGEELHLEATAVVAGSRRFLVVARDDARFVEQLHLLQRARELSLSHAELSREMERRDVLVHCIVHDLAGPLNSILGTLSLLEERLTAEQDAGLVRVGMRAAMRQRTLIREILEAFSAERGAADAARDDRAEPDLRAAVVEVAEALAPMARSRGVRLASAPGSGPPCRIVGDERRLSRVLFNLVDNAIRYTPAGRAVRVAVEEDPGGVRVLVDDEGPGLPPEVAPHLFQKFARGRDSAAGTGLGLYFCRITVESWGGSIGHEERPEGGSRFWARLRRSGSPARRGEADPGGADHGQGLDR